MSKRTNKAAAEAPADPPSSEVPVAQAVRIAEECDQTAVMICAANRERRRITVTSYGLTAEDKLWTADVGDRMRELLGGEWTRPEDFRIDPMALNAAYLREALELLQTVVRQGSLDPVTTQRVVKLLNKT